MNLTIIPLFGNCVRLMVGILEILALFENKQAYDDHLDFYPKRRSKFKKRLGKQGDGRCC